MKDTKQTLLEIVHHVAASHPELRLAIEGAVLQAQGKSLFDAHLLLALHESILRKSRAQLRQDIFVLSELNYKRNGYFVEFGATNGVDLSNTHLLEVEYGWRGILAEPATLWHGDLVRNRKARIDKRCVWKRSGDFLLFNETAAAELSTIEALSSSDYHAEKRVHGNKYMVETVSLTDLLVQHEAPNEIDYLSIDTEGSEFDILEGFDFGRYRFKIITCEHNHTPMREKLEVLLRGNGYRRKYEGLSQFDDWWVRE